MERALTLDTTDRNMPFATLLAKTPLDSMTLITVAHFGSYKIFQNNASLKLNNFLFATQNLAFIITAPRLVLSIFLNASRKAKSCKVGQVKVFYWKKLGGFLCHPPF